MKQQRPSQIFILRQPLRYAGMCPAAAAGSEDDDRTGERIIVHVFYTRHINRLAERHAMRKVRIKASLILGRRPIYAKTTRIESLDVILQLGGGGRFGSHKAAVQIVPVGRHVVKLGGRGQEPAAGTGRCPQRGLPCVVAGRVAVVVQGAVETPDLKSYSPFGPVTHFAP